MEKTVSVAEILEEFREIKQRIRYLEELIGELMDSTLTPEEEELIRKHRAMIKKGDFSEFIDADDLCIE